MSSILQVDSVARYIGELVLFENINLQLNKGDKAALIGVNGTGKTTLLNMIAENERPDAGWIKLTTGIKIAYLTQEPVFDQNYTVMEAIFKSEDEAIHIIQEYEEALLSNNLKRIDKAVGKMEHLRLWDYENRIKQILTQLNLTNYSQRISELSGGQIKRVAIANTLVKEADLLILDEPTNHLDLDLIEWLENYLLRSSATLLMVTHDRLFLDRICNAIIEIDQRKVYEYEGNYSRFAEQREKRIELEQLEVEKAQNLLRKEEDWMSRMPKARTTKAKYRINNYYRLKEKSAAKRNDKKITINVRESRLGSKVLVAKNLNFKWDDTCYLNNFSYTFSRFEKIGIIGNNGSGKTTLLEILSQNLKPDIGTLETGETIKIGYYRQKGMEFNENMRVIDALTEIAETIILGDGTVISASQFLNHFLFHPARQRDFIYKLSGGEKRRLYLCQVLMKNPNFLILDEPTNDLDIASLQVLEEYLTAFNGCVLVVSHDRSFMDNVVDHLFVFESKGEIKDFPGNYSDYFSTNRVIQKEIVKLEGIEKKTQTEKPEKKTSTKLSFNEKIEFEKLGNQIKTLENEKALIEQQLSSGKLTADELIEKSTRIGSIQTELENKSDRWFELSEKQ